MVSAAPQGPPAPAGHEVVEFGRSVEGRPIRGMVFGADGPTVLILGGIHGDEPAAADLVGLLADYLEQHPEAAAGKRVILIPRANPDGLHAGTRTNARRVDVNRNFPTRNFVASEAHGPWPLSEPESRALEVCLLLYRPRCIVSVHGPLDCVDPDGPPASYALARQMAAAGPLPLRDLPALPGSLGSYGGVEKGLKMITYELNLKRTPAGDSARLKQHLPALLLAIRNG